MILTLEVSAPQGAKPGVLRSQVFNEAGGIIGRGNESSLVLPHAKVSGRHAVISYRNSVFYIEDTSRNGVCINSAENRLVPGRPYALKSGDRIFIDPYEIHASITEEPSNPFLDVEPFAQRGASELESSTVAPAVEAMRREDLDPLRFLPSSERPPVRRAPAPEGPTHRSLESEYYQFPSVLPAPVSPRTDEPEMPREGYNPLDPDDGTRSLPPPSLPPIPRVEQSSSAVNPPPVTPAVETAGTGDDVVPRDLGDELEAADFGQILRVVVEGVMGVLDARRQIREEFGMSVTHFRPAGNNPLKLSANPDHALQNLLLKRNPAYLPPVEAFEDAFEDLRNHQMAMLAGMRAAFESMLAEFAPDRLQEQFDRQLKGSILSVPAKLRYWDLYRDRCHDMVKDLHASFRDLFGEEFARAYEDQLRRLKRDGAQDPEKGRR